MECPSCQKENRGGRRFCAHCGAPLPLGCASCGFPNQPGDGFCGGCGAALSPPAGQGDSPAGPPAGAPAASAVPGGERRQATVLFSDLSGYTELNEQVDPEEVQAIMARVKSAATRIVEAHGGMVNQFVGDEVVALFGIPTAQEDDPRRAVAAALELHGAVRDIGAEMEPGQGQGLRLHSGINSGLVVTQLHDDRDGRYGITGDTVNIGARLAAAAQPGQILLGPSTQALVKPYFELQPLSAVLLKGKEAPVTPFLVVRETKVHTRLEISAQRGFTPFIGRERELAALQHCIALAMAGRGQFASLVGDAGVGKSRLMYELGQTTDAGAAIMLQGSCEPSASGTPFYPFLAPLRELLELGDEPASDSVVATRLARIDPALEAKIPHVLRLLSIPSATHTLPAQLYGEELQRELRLALAAVVTSLARSSPVLLFFEDWHWCDEASDATLKYLGGLIAETPIMIVVNHRPDYQANWGHWGYSTIMPLAAFGEAESRQIAQQTLGVERFPEQLLAVIHERTGGNPFFLEELCRAMVEDGSLIIQNVKEAVLSGALENLAFPETVQAVVRSRLDRLDKVTREVVLNASVIGREFSGSLLNVLMPGARGIPAALERLKALEIVRQIRVLPEPEYRFQQVVTQEVAYDVQLLNRRRTLHRKLAEHLEENEPQRLPEIQELLAMHFLRGEVWPKAAAYSLAAAEQARSHFSYRAAMKL
ncbi:MAG: adenylate/guanylate cyclase domain-containing protein, partial [bacterium]